MALPGTRPISSSPVFVGPDPSQYAFTRVATQRNMYRVSLHIIAADTSQRLSRGVF